MASELEAVVSAIIKTVADADVCSVMPQFPHSGKKRHISPVLVLGVGGARIDSCGFAEYLGVYHDEITDKYTELYGKRCEMTLCAKIYSPDDEKNGASACFSVFSALAEALSALPSGIKLRALTAGATRYDSDTSMFELEAELKFSVYYYALSEDGTEFTDFYVKGVLI